MKLKNAIPIAKYVIFRNLRNDKREFMSSHKTKFKSRRINDTLKYTFQKTGIQECRGFRLENLLLINKTRSSIFENDS